MSCQNKQTGVFFKLSKKGKSIIKPVGLLLSIKMLQSIIGVLFGTNNKIKIQLDKSIYYTGEEVKILAFYFF